MLYSPGFMELSPQPSKSSEPLYEVLNYDAVLELLDTEGRDAVYTKRQTVRFLQNQVTSWYDYGWGNGIAFAEHEVSPGKIVERQLLGSRHRIHIELPEPKSKGEVLTFTVHRSIKNGLLSPSAHWLEAELYHVARRLALRVLLPASRPVRSAHIVSLRAPEPEAVVVLREADGRQSVAYVVPRPTIGERYTLLWDWA